MTGKHIIGFLAIKGQYLEKKVKKIWSFFFVQFDLSLWNLDHLRSSLAGVNIPVYNAYPKTGLVYAELLLKVNKLAFKPCHGKRKTQKASYCDRPIFCTSHPLLYLIDQIYAQRNMKRIQSLPTELIAT